MLQDAILQCETSTKFTPEARPRRVGPKRRGRQLASRGRVSSLWTTSGRFSVKSKSVTPFVTTEPVEEL